MSRILLTSLMVAAILPGCRDSRELPQPMPAIRAGEDDTGGIPQRGRDSDLSKQGIVTLQTEINAAQGNDYDSSTTVTVTAAILGKYVTPLPDGRPAITIRIQPGGENMKILVAPDSFLAERGIDLGVTDKVTVIGSLVTRRNQRTIIPTIITWREKQVRVRHDNGSPLW